MIDRAIEFFASLLPKGSSDRTAAFALPAPTGAADAFLALALATRSDKASPVLAITPGIPDAERLAADLKLLASTVRILDFPPRLADDRSAIGIRLKTVAALKAYAISPYPAVIVAPYAALATPIPKGAAPSIALGRAQITFADLAARLSELGYSRVPQVEGEGDYSIRGGIVDAWSPGEEFPIRAEFFGDDLESLRSFDVATQISIERLESVELLPATDSSDASATVTLFDLLPPRSTVLALDHNSYTLPATDGLNLFYTGEPAPPHVPSLPIQTVPLPGFAELGAEESHHPELFDAARQRLDRHLQAAEQRGALILHLDDLSSGFEITRHCQPSTSTSTSSLLVVTKADRVFTKRHAPTRHAAVGNSGRRLGDFEDLEPGEYVVHVDYGVGRFIGSSEILTDGRRSEVYTIEYDGGALLHVPAAHAHLLSRYVGVKGESVHLHRLDGKRWTKDKENAQRAVTDLAAALLETQAKRETIPGFAYDVNCDGKEAFDAAFPYEETPDQSAAIAAVEKDLASTKPMDRLICGDAGYGKTEVAMRAAFIAAMNGKQVAVLAPTTVLAEQHFETFTSRFDGTPVRIESMSRFQSAATHDGTVKRLLSGACDILIGTHAILSSKVVFRDLGLIIIDEEQRFGVRHKEHLKALRATADVLTLSATPIPRTLYLSMTGARDLSLLRTPPTERVAVETNIVTDSDEIVRAAIDAELARGGQVFFLHNRVATIGKVEKRLKELWRGKAPRIVVAHGQMDAKTLARKMRAFERGEYDILLSTTIVESGIDIPRANTILVSDAHTFGLSDLYQLRGRVGRSSRQGRAVFLLPTGGLVDSDARERLAALKRHGGLGAGFNLAVRDLELRGAGNLLGSQQSGHIAAVGFGLYCQLLKRTITIMKGEKVRDIVDVKLNLDFIDLSPASSDESAAAAFPYSYIEEDALRLGFMKRLAELDDLKSLKAVTAEITDRFGPMPAAAKRLMKLSELRLRSSQAGVGIIDTKGDRAICYRAGGREIVLVIDLRGNTPDRRIGELIKAVEGLKK